MNPAKQMLKWMFKLWTLANRGKDKRTVKRAKRPAAAKEAAPLNFTWLNERFKQPATKHVPEDKGYVTVGRNEHGEIARPWKLDKAIKRHEKFLSSN